jgi:hypothetical protein
MLPAEKCEALQSYLGALPGRTLLRLAKAVELDRLYGRTMPHEEILDILRPTLRAYDEGDRVPTPERAFCIPFEDLLFDGPRKEKRKGCIARAAIAPLWQWLAGSLIPKETEAYIAEFTEIVTTADKEAQEKCAALFRLKAGAAMMHAFAENPTEAKAAFADEMLAEDAKEIALLETAGPLLMEVKTLFPRRSPEPDEEKLHAFRNLYERSIQIMPDAAPYLPVAAMGRLEKPWQAVRLAMTVSRLREDTLVSSTDMGLIGEILFARMEDDRDALAATPEDDFDPDAMIDRLTDFTLLSGAITKEVDMLRSGRWGKRLSTLRASVGGIMEGYMAHALKEIVAVLPMKRSRGGALPLVPDFSVPTDDGKIAGACRSARLIAGCKYLAAAATFVVKYREAAKAAVDLLCFFDKALVAEIQSGAAPGGKEEETGIDAAVGLTRILLSSEEAELLQHRCTAARAA